MDIAWTFVKINNRSNLKSTLTTYLHNHTGASCLGGRHTQLLIHWSPTKSKLSQVSYQRKLPSHALLDFWINTACGEVSKHQSSPGSSSTTLRMCSPSSRYLLASTTLLLPCSLFSAPHPFAKAQTKDHCPSCDPHRGTAAKNTWLSYLMPFFTSVTDYITFTYPIANSSQDSSRCQRQLERPQRSLEWRRWMSVSEWISNEYLVMPCT